MTLLIYLNLDDALIAPSQDSEGERDDADAMVVDNTGE
jgi:hypothetical protein